ncbi:MAG: hypothetical protein WC975_09465 [Phycisphaerae bacterium]
MNDQLVNKKPLWRRILRKIFFIGVILIVAGIAVLSVWNLYASNKIKKEISKIRTTGEPVTFADLEARLPKVDEAVNAARYYQAGMDLIIPVVGQEENSDLNFKFSEYVKKSPHTLPDPLLMNKAKKFLEANQLALEMLAKGAEFSACRNELWIKNGIGATLEQLRRPRNAAKLLSLRSMYLAAQGKGDQAVDSVISSLRMTRIFDGQMILITFMVKISCLATAYNDASFVLEFSHPSEKSSARLQHALLDTDQPKDLEQMILTERVYSIEWMGNIFPVSKPFPASSAIPLPERMPGFYGFHPSLRLAGLNYLCDMTQFLTAARKPWPVVFDAMQSFQPTGIFGNTLVLAKVAITFGRNLAKARSICVAVMIERYRLAHGKLPEKLSDLVPAYTQAIPMDPFTGKDLLYRHDKDSYTVYSVGDDRKDDGGIVDLQPTGKQAMGPGPFLPPPGSKPSGQSVSSVQGGKTRQDWGVKIRLLPR